MRIAIVGTGYVGLVSAACFAELGHTVIGVDIDAAKVAKLQSGKSTIYEPGLEELIQRGLRKQLLSFTTDLVGTLPNVQIVFSAVATPPGEGYHADLRAVFSVAETVAKHANHSLLFVNKSTVPVGTGKECEARMSKIITERGVDISIPVISNPEFLREGMAVPDTLMPDRIVVGINGGPEQHTPANELQPWHMMEELYRPITRVGKPLVFMSRESAEIVKYASNAFLATKISFINMLSELCEVTGGNVRDVAKGMGLDGRIGPRFLHAGIGYGGSCFPKDVKALLATAKQYNLDFSIVEATDQINARQRKRFFDRILQTVTPGQTVAVWGLSFKPKTDDMREAPSLDLLPLLVQHGCQVKAYDPEAMEVARKLIPAQVQLTDSAMAAVQDADVLVVLTEWDEFRGADLVGIERALRGRAVFDGRNVYEPAEVRRAGLEYYGIGIH